MSGRDIYTILLLYGANEVLEFERAYDFMAKRDTHQIPICMCMELEMEHKHNEGYCVLNRVLAHTLCALTCPQSSRIT